MVLSPKYELKIKYFRIQHCCFNKIFYSEFNSFFLVNKYFKIKPLEVSIGIGIRSHINLIMAIFYSCNDL